MITVYPKHIVAAPKILLSIPVLFITAVNI